MFSGMNRIIARAVGLVGLAASPAALAHPGVTAQSPWLVIIVHKWLHAVHDEPAALVVLGVVAAAVVLAATRRRSGPGRPWDRR